MDTITERLALLILDNKQRSLTEDADLRLGYGLCGALVLDLLLAGALEQQADGSFLPCPAAELKPIYLREAFGAIPNHAMLDREELFRILYGLMPRLKAHVFDALVKQGVAYSDTVRLKWSFSFTSYALNPEKSGYRSKVMRALLNNKIQLPDFWAVQLALASRLLWTEEGKNKKRQQMALARAKQLQAASGQIGHVLQLVENTLPDTIAESHKLPKLGKKSRYPVTWEWRGFWTDEGAKVMQPGGICRQWLENIAFSETIDCYLVVEGMAENIKNRKDTLEVKRPLESQQGYTAFSPKETYTFPLSAKNLHQLFPHLPLADSPVADMDALAAWLQQQGIRCTQTQVKKKRFHMKLQSLVRVEFCTLQLDGRKFRSICVEGPDYNITTAHSHNFQLGDVMEMGYVEFLKHWQMELAQ